MEDQFGSQDELNELGNQKRMSADELPNDLPNTQPSVEDLLYGENGQIVVLPDEIDE